MLHSPPLAIFGASPAFRDKLHVGRPNLGDRKRLLERIEEMLDRRWFTNDGPFVLEFEQRLADDVGVRHAIAMCNGTVALEIAIRAAGLRSEVIVPSYTFIATAHALQWQEITPVFADIDPRTHCLDPKRVEAMITPRTTGIIGTHLWGNPCDVEALQEIADRRGLTLLFDAAHAFGCTHKGRPIGGFGLAEVFSFHATKFVNAFEGGAVVTNDDALASRIRFMRNFGFAGYDRVDYVGTNGKMSEPSAAMGLTSLESIEKFVAHNYRNYREYATRLARIPGLVLLAYNQTESSNYQYIVVEVEESKLELSRDELVTVLHAENILARRYFSPGCHKMEPYRSYFPHAGLLLPVTERMASRVLVLPTGSSIGESEIEKIVDVMQTAARHAPSVRRRLMADAQGRT
jgi:dTDP-4-amino-4,6-dideoxygalactose transaminase